MVPFDCNLVQRDVPYGEKEEILPDVTCSGALFSNCCTRKHVNRSEMDVNLKSGIWQLDKALACSILKLIF